MIRTFIALAMAAGCLHAAEPRVVDAAFLGQLREEAARHHPSVASAGLRATAAAQDIATVRLWDDPMAGLSFMAAPREMRMDDGDVMVGIEQPLEAIMLKKRYISLMKQHHPDVNKSAENAAAQTKRINVAYRILTDYAERHGINPTA